MRKLLVALLVVGMAPWGCQKEAEPDEAKAETANKSEKEKRADGEESAEKDTITDKMAEEHEGDEPKPSGAAKMEPSQPVTGQQVDYATLDGTKVSGYMAKPTKAEGKLPGLIVIQEWWGLNDNIRKMTDRLAGEGYVALAVDLYEGEVAEKPEKARELMQKAMGNKERLGKNLQQAYDFVADESGAEPVGVIGWCFGGGWSLQTALMMPDKIDATVIYYGQLVTDEEKLKAINSPIIGFFGSEDSAIPPKQVETFEETLKGLDKTVETHVYQGANHAFANPSGERYDAEAATDAWKKTVTFLNKHLKSTE